MSRIRPTHTLFPYTTLFRSHLQAVDAGEHDVEDDDVGLEALRRGHARGAVRGDLHAPALGREAVGDLDRKSTRLNSSHVAISYAVFCLKKKNHISGKATAQE